CSLVIFPIMFSFDLPPEGGFGLVFTTLPILFTQLPAGHLISSLFFLLFVFTALTSAIPLVEVVAATLMDLLGWKRHVPAVPSARRLLSAAAPALSPGHTACLVAGRRSLGGPSFRRWTP